MENAVAGMATPDQVMEMLHKPMEFYQSAPVDGEFQLLAAIRQRMAEKGLGDRLPAAFDQNRFIIEGQGRPAHAQQYNAIRWLTLQFMHAKDCEETRLARYSLIYEVSPAEFMVIFEQSILPALVNFDLPVVL